MMSYRAISKKVFASILLVCALAGNASAAGNHHFIGDLTDTTFVQAYSFAPGAVITDVFHFDLSGQSTFNSVVSQIALQSFFNISGFSLTLAMPSGPTFSFSPTGNVIWSNLLVLPQNTDYQLTVSGLADGSLGGSYSVLMAAASSVQNPIPEPEQWLLLLAGIALLPIATRKRAKR